MKVKNAVYLNADKTKAVSADSPEAAFILAGAGSNVSDEDVEKYKLTEHGAPGQKDVQTTPVNPAMVTDQTPDGVNTAEGSPAAMGIREQREADAKAKTDAASKTSKAADDKGAAKK